MDINFPSAEQVRALLAPLTLKQLDRLAELSAVPATTIYKIKRGETKNPGVETLRAFMPHIAEASRLGAAPEAEAPAATAGEIVAHDMVRPTADVNVWPTAQADPMLLHPDDPLEKLTTHLGA